MGYFNGDPYPCTGLETPGAVLRLNEDGTAQGNETALNASACFADWYLGSSKWIWRDGDPDAPPAIEVPDEPPAGAPDDAGPGQ